MKKVKLYTDGACSGNPGVGGWGAILIYGEYEKRFSGFEESTTNNRMEINAVIEGLNKLKEPCDVEVYSDSAYVVNAIERGWVEDWAKNGWKKADGKKVLNVELWQRLNELCKINEVKFIKVKGHADNEYNNACDKLATDAIKKFKESL